MTEDLRSLEQWVEPLLARLQPQERARLSRRVGMVLRRSEQRRIAAQRNPDGSAFAPRRKPDASRKKAGRIKRVAMFVKIRQAKHLRLRADAQQVSVGFVGRVSRIAQVHQEGRSDSVSRGGPRVRYQQRRLLGFSDANQALIRDTIMDQLTAGLP